MRVREDESCEGKEGGRYMETETDRDKASACHAEKKCWVGRLRVPIHDKEQKQEGCRPDQVGAA